MSGRKPNIHKAMIAKAKVVGYQAILAEVVDLLESARRASARAVNGLLTATYWQIGRRIVDSEQAGRRKAGYGRQLIDRLSDDLTERFGRGFARRNLFQMRAFYLAYPHVPKALPNPAAGEVSGKVQTLSAQSSSVSGGAVQTPSSRRAKDALEKVQTVSAQLVGRHRADVFPKDFTLAEFARLFPLPWSHYVLLLSARDPNGRSFYESEALRNGWTVRQLDRQISTKFYERTLLSRNKGAMLKRVSAALPEDVVTPEEEIKDPFVLEFLGLKDEYSENDLEEALIRGLENFLMELGGDFAFVGRQRRLRVGNEWYRVDLLFFHRRLRCLVVIDLKVGKFSHADAGQMHLYLNYVRDHLTHEGENPPVGLILCAEKDAAVAHYALDGLPNKVLAAEYRMKLPDEKTLAAELDKTRRMLEARRVPRSRQGRSVP